MIIVLPFHAADATIALRLLEYIHQLGETREYSLVLVADAAVPWERGVEISQIANKAFRTVQFITTDESVIGWPEGPNALFLRAAEYCQLLNQPFLWLEPDCVPLRPSWLKEIHAEIGKKGANVIGHVYTCTQPGLPPVFVSGVAIYPPDTAKRMGKLIRATPHVAWDVATAEEFAPKARHTPLIHHFNPPTGSPVSFPAMMKVEDIPKNAALFHKNKDGTLIFEMRRRLGLEAPENFVVVLPFHNYDSALAEQLLQWMVTLQVPPTHEILLSHDASTLASSVRRIEEYAKMSFTKVHRTSYRVHGGCRFPQTAAWQHAARYMEGHRRSWLWMEADSVPLRQDFLPALQEEYVRCGKPFAGPFVHARGHMNGTAIYPADTPKICPRTMSHTENAWDVEMADEMMGLAHDIGKLFYHVWGVHDGKLDPIQGDAPSFNPGLLRQIPPSAVILHRCKDGSLFNLLRPRLPK